MILVGVAGTGTLVFTLLAKIAIPLAFRDRAEEAVQSSHVSGPLPTGPQAARW
jgi:hypothetical protein